VQPKGQVCLCLGKISIIRLLGARESVRLISEISPQDAFQIESELFVKYYSERKKKEVATDVTYSTIPQFYFKVR